MPTKMKSRGGQWLARVYVNGRQTASRIFPAGRKGGPEWREAKAWEEAQREAIKAGAKIISDSETFSQWLKLYVAHTRRTMTKKTADEKAAFLADFADWCLDRGIKTPAKITPQLALEFLTGVYDRRGGHVANKYRKHLLAAWNWGTGMVDDFPDRLAPFKKVRPFKVAPRDRYVPPDEDVAAALAQVKGQDALMLAFLVQTGARRGEVFRLTWADVDLENKRVRLTDRKGGDGAYRERWRGIDDHLAVGLAWWRENRPAIVDNVFMQLGNCATINPATGQTIETNIGDPYKTRRHFMSKLCRRAGVKPFGFHALRHKAAALLYLKSGLNEAQLFLGHARPTTTNAYVKSAGLYTGQDQLVNVIIESSLGRAASKQVQKVIAPEAPTSEAIL